MNYKKHIDNQYLNIFFTPDQSNGSAPSVATYDQSLTQPILADPSEYYCSVIRFQIPITTIPLLIFPVDTSQNNPNLSNWIIGINVAGVSYPAHITYVPTSNASVPIAAGSAPYFTPSQATSPYYYVYSIQHIIDMINTGINTAMTAAGLGTTNAPFFTYNSANQLITLNFNATFLGYNAKLYVNAFLIEYVNAFDFFFNGYNQPNGYDFYYILAAPLNQAGPAYTITQEYTTLALWFDLRKILITSNTLPINYEVTPSQGINGVQTGVSNYIPIMTDFGITIDSIEQFQSIINYNPTSQYRLIDMIGNTPLNRLNFNILWADRYGNIFPLTISQNEQATMKIGFFKKHLYNTFDASIELELENLKNSGITYGPTTIPLRGGLPTLGSGGLPTLGSGGEVGPQNQRGNSQRLNLYNSSKLAKKL